MEQWTRGDVEAARPQINDTPRPCPAAGPTPEPAAAWLAGADKPLGETGTKRIAAKLGLESTLRPHDRPRKKRAEDDS